MQRRNFFFSGIFASVVGTVLLATLLDIIKYRKYMIIQLTNFIWLNIFFERKLTFIFSENQKLAFFYSFSVLRSYEALFQDVLPMKYRIFLFLKTVAIILVIIGHTAVFEFRLSIFQTEVVEEVKLSIDNIIPSYLYSLLFLDEPDLE